MDAQIEKRSHLNRRPTLRGTISIGSLIFDENKTKLSKTILRSFTYLPQGGLFTSLNKICDLAAPSLPPRPPPRPQSVKAIESGNNIGNEVIKLFRSMDRDNSGTISSNELKRALIGSGHRFTDAEITRIIEAADTNGDGKLNLQGEF